MSSWNGVASAHQSSAKSSALSLDISKTAYGYVSTEMDVLLPIRVSITIQELIEVTQVAVLTACEAKS